MEIAGLSYAISRSPIAFTRRAVGFFPLRSVIWRRGASVRQVLASCMGAGGLSGLKGHTHRSHRAGAARSRAAPRPWRRTRRPPQSGFFISIAIC